MSSANSGNTPCLEGGGHQTRETSAATHHHISTCCGLVGRVFPFPSSSHRHSLHPGRRTTVCRFYLGCTWAVPRCHLSSSWALLGFYGAWVPPGLCLGSTWVLRCLGSTWALLGFYLGYAWALPGFYLGSTWVLAGLYLGSTWVSVGFQLGSTWDLPGFYMGSSWVLPGLCLGSTLVLPGFYLGSTLVLPGVYPGSFAVYGVLIFARAWRVASPQPGGGVCV